jgi:acetyl-CoA C-acetyltransferase
MVAAKCRNAAKNKYAHLQWPGWHPRTSPRRRSSPTLQVRAHLPGQRRRLGIVIADESLALKKGKPVAWFKGLASYTDEENQLQSENFGGVGVTDPSEQRGCWLSAMKAYKQAGIVDPSKEIDVAEIYQPFPSQELFFAERLGLFDEGTAWMALERGETEINGRMPCDPS